MAKKQEETAAQSDTAKEDAAKRKAAEEAAAAAAEASKAATAAADEAKRRAEEAAAAQAAAEGRVLCTVPRRFGIMLAGRQVIVEPGSQSLPREVAEHPYARDHGVKIVGLPTETGKK